MKTFNKLTDSQVAVLEAQSCRCGDWTKVCVPSDFNPKYVRDVTFSGEVRLGSFKKTFVLAGGIEKHSGIYHATLHNVIVGDDCMIEHIGNYIANYIIGDGTYIENVTDIIVSGESSFGNGVSVNVLDETGGREVLIHDNLSSHEAYIMALYRHRPSLTEALRKMVLDHAAAVRSSFGRIGSNVEIMDSMHIVNVNIDDCCKIKGVSRLKNGTVHSNSSAPSFVGMNVIADDFIMASGSRVADGVMINRCYVGQACSLGHGYSATDSLFFSNCQGENGEACSLFAGPYTVTHHKSTLLIAGMFSFMNAGSGSNQSNHMYKLGPIHQGIMERGAKTTSDSYILWPARIGAFSLVMGRHVNNPDTSVFPFSYIIEQQGTTYIIPGVNLKSVGTIRDVKKWPQRDKRTDPDHDDYVNFNHLSPYTVGRMLEGVSALEKLKEASGHRADNYCYKKSVIRNSSLFKGLKYYDMAILKFLGNSFISRIQSADVSSDEALRRALVPDCPEGRGVWVDVSGLIAPSGEIEKLCSDIENMSLDGIEEIGKRFAHISEMYYSYEWTWSYDAIESYLGINLEKITRKEAADFVAKWKNAVVSLDKLIYEDAAKEYDLSSMTGFGADGDKIRRNEDFANVRGGNFENNPFVMEVLDHIERKKSLGDAMISSLKD